MIRVWESFACEMYEKGTTRRKKQSWDRHKETKITLARGEMKRKERQGWNFEEQLCWG